MNNAWALIVSLGQRLALQRRHHAGLTYCWSEIQRMILSYQGIFTEFMRQIRPKPELSSFPSRREGKLNRFGK
jgi:hypothetical protein